MTDFKTNIKQRYAEQVQPVVPADGWEQFEQFRNIRRKRKRRFPWLLLPVGLLVGSVAVWLLSDSKAPSEIEQIVQQPIDQVLNSVPPGNTDNSLKTIEIDRNQKDEILNNNSKITNNFHGTNSKSQIVSNTQNTNSDNQNSNILSVAPIHSTHSSPQLTGVDASNNFVKTSTVIQYPDIFIKFLPHLRPSVQLQKKPFHTLPFASPIAINCLPKKALGSLPTGVFFVGAGFPNTNQTLEETAFLFGLTYNYPIWKRWHLKSDVSFHNIYYQTSIMSPELGLRSIGAPQPGQSFTKAEVESNSIQLGMGLKYNFIHRKYFNLSASMNYLIAKELTKDSDYFFEGQVSSDVEDDEVITLRNTENYFVYNMLKPEINVSFSYSNTGYNLGIAYPFQLNKPKYTLLDHWQLKMGIQHKF